MHDFVLASWVGMMPGTVMFMYLGSIERTPTEWTLYGVGLIATVAVAVIVTRSARRSLAHRTASPASA